MSNLSQYRFSHRKLKQARKLHRCCEAVGRRVLIRRDTYVKAFIVQDGDASNFKTCHRNATEARDWLL